MSWRVRLSVETILRLTPAALGSTVFSIAGFVRRLSQHLRPIEDLLRRLRRDVQRCASFRLPAVAARGGRQILGPNSLRGVGAA